MHGDNALAEGENTEAHLKGLPPTSLISFLLVPTSFALAETKD